MRGEGLLGNSVRLRSSVKLTLDERIKMLRKLSTGVDDESLRAIAKKLIETLENPRRIEEDDK
jgi:hypothetical protein